MHATDLAVTLAALVGIGWVNWYFFLADRGSAQAAPASQSESGRLGAQSVTITVRGGYDPSTIHVRAGVPVTLEFDRQETSGCSEEIVFPAFGLRKYLPAHERTTVTVTPPLPGTYEFTCGMSMLHGRLVAE